MDPESPPKQATNATLRSSEAHEGPAPHSPDICTYHCLCTNLLFASSTPLSSLVRRSANSLDSAYILPLPPPPSNPTKSSPSSSGSSSPSQPEPEPEPEPERDEEQDAVLKSGKREASSEIAVQKKRENQQVPHYALLLGTLLDRKPVVVRRTDGFEKRYLQRCGRCKVVVGYQLDWAQFPTLLREGDGPAGQEESRQSRRADVVYLLPGGLMSTEEMASGKSMDSEIEFHNMADTGGQAFRKANP